MSRRRFLFNSMATVALLLTTSKLCGAASDTVLVQIKVYRTLRPGIYESYPGVTVKLSNNMTGVTQATPGMLGVWNTPVNIPKRNYTGQAFVKGRWISGTRYEWINARFLRIHVDLSKI